MAIRKEKIFMTLGYKISEMFSNEPKALSSVTAM